MEARRPAWFALDSPQTLYFRFPSANRGPGISGFEARRPAWFALDSPQALYFRFPGANLGPGFSRLAARRPAWFALTSPQALCFRFPGANLGPGFSGLEARRSAWFALDSPQALYFRFPGANLGPGISGLGARRPAWFALTFPQALCFRFPGANRRPGPAGFSKARFAPPSPRALAAPSRGANSSHKFRAAGRGRAAFPWRGLLPAPRKPLQLRSGEQILHTNSAPTPETGRLFQGAVCSPLPANPCSFVPGSKIFTEIPRRRLPPAAFSAARFVPRSSLALAAPFRGANSSHNSRADTEGRRPFPWRGLLPPPREPLQFRSGEQILHTISAPSPSAGRLFQGAVCSPLLASPCGSVPGSKFFTQIPRRHPGPAGFSKARFAPRSPLTLAAPFRGANSSHKFRASVQKAPCRFIGKVLPSPQQSPAGPSPAGHF